MGNDEFTGSVCDPVERLVGRLFYSVVLFEVVFPA